MTIQVEHITKTFGRLRANDDISIVLENGHIYAVLGENGAGKSTLMKILSGYQPADSGTICVNGMPVEFHSPADALQHGIGMLHQDPLDVANLTILENFMLGRPDGVIPQYKTARRELLSTAQKLGFQLNPSSYIDTLTIGERQQLEIVRLLSRGAKILILDEPTTGISAEQKNTLFDSLRQLARHEGMTVVLVSHKLEDVEALCDQVIVLREGKVVGERQAPFHARDLVPMMFGQIAERTPRQPVAAGQCTLSVKYLTVPDRRLVVRNIDLEVCQGQVIGLAGLDGSGQRGFVRALAGLQAIHAGTIELDGQPITHRSYHDRVHRGIAYAPAGRLEEGLVNGLTLAEHFALVEPGGAWLDWKHVHERTDHQIKHYSIRGRMDSQIQTLSGGNQQRAVLALLPPKLKVLLMEEPTRGLDVESARWVWKQLLERCQQGTAIVFASTDLDEIVEYSDRILVFFGGHATPIDDVSQVNVDQLGTLIGGKTPS